MITNKKIPTELENIFYVLKNNEININDKQLYYSNIDKELQNIFTNYKLSYDLYYFIVPTVIATQDHNKLLIQVFNTVDWDKVDLRFELRFEEKETFGSNCFTYQVNNYNFYKIKHIDEKLYKNIMEKRKDIAFKSKYYIPASDLTYNIVQSHEYSKRKLNVFEIDYHAFYNPNTKCYYFINYEDMEFAKYYIDNYIDSINFCNDLSHIILNDPRCKIIHDFIDVDSLNDFYINNLNNKITA